MSFLTNGKKIDDKKGPMTISARPGVRKTENEKKKKLRTTLQQEKIATPKWEITTLNCHYNNRSCMVDIEYLTNRYCDSLRV